MLDLLEDAERGEFGDPRFAKLPLILLYCDVSEFGEAIFLFVSHSIKSKRRTALWYILEWLALEMPTTKVLELLESETHLLNSHDLPKYHAICMATMAQAEFPIAVMLKLVAFLNDRAVDLSNKDQFIAQNKQYVDVSRRLLKEIDSDHLQLLGLLLMLPTGIEGIIEQLIPWRERNRAALMLYQICAARSAVEVFGVFE